MGVCNRLKTRVAISAAALVAAGAAYIAGPSALASAATTPRTTTDCASKVVWGLGTEYTGCLTANDWWVGADVATNWNSTSCTSEWWYGFACADRHSGHYWNGWANVDWGCVTVMEYVAVGTETYSVHLNIFTRPGGYTTYGNWINLSGGC